LRRASERRSSGSREAICDLDRAKKWYQSQLVNHLRTYKTAAGYELWGND